MILTLLLTGCGDDKNLSSSNAADMQPGEESYCYLNVSISLNNPSTRAHFDDGGDSLTGPYNPSDIYTPGTVLENTINRITFFVYEDGVDEEAATPVVVNVKEYYFGINIDGTDNNPLALSLPLPGVTGGRRHIYCAANLTDAMIEQVKQHGPKAQIAVRDPNNNVADALANNTYGMAMTCVQPQTVTLHPGEAAYANFNLRRTVAKVLVTAKEGAWGKAVTPGKFDVEIAEIYYTLNSHNSTAYLFQQIEGLTAKDPNYTLADASDKNIDNTFVYHPYYSWVNYRYLMQNVAVFEADKLPDYTNRNPADVYTEGMYCFENTFYPADIAYEDDSADPKVPKEYCRKQITHVAIHAKIIPIEIYVYSGLAEYITKQYGFTYSDLTNDLNNQRDTVRAENKINVKDGFVFKYKCANRTESELIRQFSLDYEGYHGTTNDSFFRGTSEGTKDLLFTYSAAKRVVKGESYVQEVDNLYEFEGMEMYTPGYATFEVPLVNISGENTKDWALSQIYRNTYYILTINEFKDFGKGTDPTENFIEIHTEVVPYMKSWSGNVTLDQDNGERLD